ncbi:MAG: hypothetical protein NZO58_01520, partial [Gemmataceae bacterium]|nr:hypothetical protein [Gemmataceae bacterium]
PSAKADTPPRSTRTLPKVAAQPLVANLRRAKLVVTTIAVGAALIVVGLLLYLLMSRETPPRGIARKPLEVTKELGRPNTYRSIEAALRVAEPGDVIQLLDADYRETLLVEPRHQLTTSVTIEAAPGREVVWRPAAKDENRPILTLQKARGFKINGKGLTFDGAIDEKRRLKDLIAINFDSPGLAIEDATFTNFSRCAVSIVNAGGAKDRPIRLLNLKYVVGAGLSPDAAVLFDAKADIEPPQNQYIELLGGSYGGLVAAKEVSNAANGVQVSWPK